MPSLRVDIPDANLLTLGYFDWSWFFKLTIGGIYGTKRYTDLARPMPGESYVGNVDGTSQTWVYRYLTCPGFNQDNAGVESVQFVEVDNLDYELSTPGADVGLMGLPYELWKVWFQADGVTIAGKYQASVGLVDDVSYGDLTRLTLKANNTYWSRRVLGPPLGPLCPYYFKDPDTCQSASANSSCSKTRSGVDGCGVGFNNNLAHFGGFDLALAPNTVLYWQGMQLQAGGGLVAPPSTPSPGDSNPIPPVTVPVTVGDSIAQWARNNKRTVPEKPTGSNS